jgi:hypothetical protein
MLHDQTPRIGGSDRYQPTGEAGARRRVATAIRMCSRSVASSMFW